MTALEFLKTQWRDLRIWWGLSDTKNRAIVGTIGLVLFGVLIFIGAAFFEGITQ